MTDSDSDMPDAIEFSAAKKSIKSSQKDLKKATLAMSSKKKRVRTRKEIDDDNDGDDNEQTQHSYVQPPRKDKNNLSIKRSMNAKVEQNLLNLINEELPQKKLKQLEGKFQVIERSNKLRIAEPKRIILQPEIQKAQKDLGLGVSVLFTKQVKQPIPASTSATNFLSSRMNISSEKRQPISRIVGRK